MKDHTDLFIALSVLIPSFLVGGIIGQVMIAPDAAEATVSQANCDKARAEPNDQGHLRGNLKQCQQFEPTEGPKEPIADQHACDNGAIRDLDEDGIVACADRGN